MGRSLNWFVTDERHTCTYLEPNFRDSFKSDIVGKKKQKPIYFCPIASCPEHILEEAVPAMQEAWALGRHDRTRGWCSLGDQVTHMNDYDLYKGDPVPVQWLKLHGKIICPICARSCTKPKGDKPPGHDRCCRMRMNVANELPRNKTVWDDVSFEEISASEPHRHRNIPAPCVVTYAATEMKLNELIAEGSDEQAMEAHNKLNALLKMVLLRQSQGGRRLRGHVAKMCSARLALFAEGKLGHLWGHVRAAVEERNAERRKRRPSKLSEMQKRMRTVKQVRAKMTQGDLSKSAAMLLSKGMARLTPTIKEQMVRKHPRSRRPD